MQAATDPHDKRSAIESARSDTTRGAGERSMQQLVQLRWIALVGQVATILFVHYALAIRLPLAAMLGVAGTSGWLWTMARTSPEPSTES